MKKIFIKSLITVFFSWSLIVVNNLTARADYIHQTLAEYSGTIMEFHVENQQITIVLEIDEKDKKVFSNLLDKNKNSEQETNLIKTNNQQSLIGEIKKIETRKRTSRGNINSLSTTNLMVKPLNIPEVSPYKPANQWK